MEHKKTYYSKELETPHGKVIIEGPVAPERLEQLQFHKDLTSFRTPEKQHAAIIGIAALPEGRIIIAREEETIIGYVTFLYPDPIERWSEGNIENLIELGAIEVVPKYRGASVGKNLLIISMMDDAMENYIILTTEYYWHWDLKSTGFDVWEYRNMMKKLMNGIGMKWFATDDPEICSHPANSLMARIGENVSDEAIHQFDLLRFKNRFMH